MATCAPDLTSLDPLFECPVCLDPFSDPRILPTCGHHFCCQCLKNLASAHPHDSIICPTCRAVSDIPTGSTVAALPKPVTVNELQVALAELQCKTPGELEELGAVRSRPCDPCGSKTVALYYCYQCKENLCDECHTTHTQASVFAGHNTADISTVVFCSIHSNQPMTAYCHDCCLAICTRCVMGAHGKHHMDDIKTAAGKCRDKLNEVLQQRIALTADQSLLASVEDKTGYIKQGYADSRQKITAAKDLVKECGRKLRALEAELEGRYGENVRKLGEYKSSIKAYVRQNTRIVDLANHLVNDATDTEVLARGKDISTVDGFKDTLSLQVPTLGEGVCKMTTSLTGMIEGITMSYHTETIGSIVRRRPTVAEAGVPKATHPSRSTMCLDTVAASNVQSPSCTSPGPQHPARHSIASPLPRELETLNLPEGWDCMKGNPKAKKKNIMVVNVRPGTTENASVLKRLLTTSDGKITGIIKIERIQNLGMHNDYVAMKEKIRMANQGTVIEQRLWHEASPAAVKRINKYGFGELGGTSLQFSCRASYQCANDVPGKTPGQRYLYSVAVLTGRAVKEGLWADPAHNSVVDNEHSTSVYTVVNCHQAYPEHLITYTGKAVFNVSSKNPSLRQS